MPVPVSSGRTPSDSKPLDSCGRDVSRFCKETKPHSCWRYSADADLVISDTQGSPRKRSGTADMQDLCKCQQF